MRVRSPHHVGMNHILHCRTDEDLLCLPAIMLGFHPENSVVVLGIKGATVEFGARVDLARVIDDPDSAMDGMMPRLPGGDDVQFAILVFGEDPERAVFAADLISVTLRPRVVAELYADATHYWNLEIEDPTLSPGSRWDFDTTPVTTTSVVLGRRIERSRESAVQVYQAPEDPSLHTQQIASAEPLAPVEVLAILASSDPLDRRALHRLAAALVDEDVTAEVLRWLSIDNASTAHDRLLELRRCVPSDYEANPVGLLGMACWLNGLGPGLTECMQQLLARHPRNNVGSVLRWIHEHMIPPTWWSDPESLSA